LARGGAAKQRKIFSPGRKPWEDKHKAASPGRATERERERERDEGYLPPVPGFNTR
jgi:hypothetical protein